MSKAIDPSPMGFYELLMQLDELAAKIDRALKPLGFSLEKPKELAEAILKLSNFYIRQKKLETPWEDKETQAAYLAYFLPLNFLRLQKVFSESEKLGFDLLFDEIVDYGSGPGTAVFAAPEKVEKHTCVETTPIPQKLFESLDYQPNFKIEWQKRFSPKEKTLGLFSYSLNESETFPKFLKDFSHLMILEPSTQDQGRRLMQLREELIAHGYHIWAPCVHKLKCPLLHQSKKDWCHNRVHWKMPSWFEEIEKHLPFKNKTFTYSYLLASKVPPKEFKSGTYRTVGDLLKEKGKTRIMVCGSEEREYLSWLKKEKVEVDIARGELIEVLSSEKKGNELRPGKDFVSKSE